MKFCMKVSQCDGRRRASPHRRTHSLFPADWQQRRQKGNFLDTFERTGKCFLVFKVEWHECNVCVELFSRPGFIANPRAHSYALRGKLPRDIAPDRAGRASYQKRFAHKFLLYSETR